MSQIHVQNTITDIEYKDKHCLYTIKTETSNHGSSQGKAVQDTSQSCYKSFLEEKFIDTG
jgi:hypothetical protein